MEHTRYPEIQEQDELVYLTEESQRMRRMANIMRGNGKSERKIQMVMDGECEKLVQSFGQSSYYQKTLSIDGPQVISYKDFQPVSRPGWIRGVFCDLAYMPYTEQAFDGEFTYETEGLMLVINTHPRVTYDRNNFWNHAVLGHIELVPVEALSLIKNEPGSEAIRQELIELNQDMRTGLGMSNFESEVDAKTYIGRWLMHIGNSYPYFGQEVLMGTDVMIFKNQKGNNVVLEEKSLLNGILDGFSFREYVTADSKVRQDLCFDVLDKADEALAQAGAAIVQTEGQQYVRCQVPVDTCYEFVCGLVDYGHDPQNAVI